MRAESIVVTAPGGSVLTFDRAGRLYSAFMDGRFYRRGVDGRVLAKYTGSEGGTIRRRLDPPAAREVVERALKQAAGAVQPLIEDLDADAARFRRAYGGPVPILPPDLYRALVLQATVGCVYNACLFCGFYRDRPFRVRSLDEFARHAREVERAFGAGISIKRGLFLGDADALAAPTDLLAGMCAEASRLEPARYGIYSFGALFGEPERPAAEWEALREAGLRRVYLGIETGHDPLRRRLGKPGSSAGALRLIQAMKRAGIAVGLIFLLGAGGPALERRHVRDSAALCNRAGLDGGDFVYLSPLVGPGQSRLRERHETQAAALREEIDPGPRVAVYDILAFVY